MAFRSVLIGQSNNTTASARHSWMVMAGMHTTTPGRAVPVARRPSPWGSRPAWGSPRAAPLGTDRGRPREPGSRKD
jgi:hypothetical protein